MRRRIALVVAICVIAGPATADAIRLPYRAALAGIEIGTLFIDIEAERYRIALEAALGPAQPNVRMQAQASGHLPSGKVQPDLYAATWSQEGANRRVAVAFADGAVGAVAVLPPGPGRGSAATQPSGRQARGVTDPLSALMIPVAQSGLAPLSACGRTQRVFDGLARYDVELFPSRAETIVMAQKPVETMVCRARLRPVNAPGTRRWPDGSPAYRALVWLAPLANEPLLLPVRIESDLRWGRLILETTDAGPFQAATRAAAQR